MSTILKFDFQKKRRIMFFWSKLSKLHKKDPILQVATTFSLKQGETRTSHGPIPHPLSYWLAYISFVSSIDAEFVPFSNQTNMHVGCITHNFKSLHWFSWILTLFTVPVFWWSVVYVTNFMAVNSPASCSHHKWPILFLFFFCFLLVSFFWLLKTKFMLILGFSHQAILKSWQPCNSDFERRWSIIIIMFYII